MLAVAPNSNGLPVVDSLVPTDSTNIVSALQPTETIQENPSSAKKDSSKDDVEIAESLAKLSVKAKKKAAAANLPILSSIDIHGIADYIKSGKAKKIIVMTGAGVSVASGIPDFRSPGTGLYFNLQKYNLPTPTAVFQIDYFKDHPQAFYTLAKELYPGNFAPTYVHYFIRLLHEKGLLLRNYTQNIDTLERVAKIPASQLVEAHGSFGTSQCIDCHKEYDSDFVKNAVFSDRIPRCSKCNGLVKPDIVFFGEGLPSRFFKLHGVDFPQCDLLIVIGTSLQVTPFAGLIKKVFSNVPRILINREEVGMTKVVDINAGFSTYSGGFTFNHQGNARDVKHIGDCQEGIKKLAELLGWGQELEELYQRESKIVLANKPASSSSSDAAKTATTK